MSEPEGCNSFVQGFSNVDRDIGTPGSEQRSLRMGPDRRLAAEVDRVVERWWMLLPELDWYVRLERDIRRFILGSPTSDLEWRVRWGIYDCVAEALQQGRVGLGQHGPDRRDRNQPITTVVIHHSGTEPGVSQERLSAMGLLRLYAPVHLDARAYPLAYKQPVYSGHWSGGRQVFYAYHWLVRTTGQVEHLLSDHRVGWHSGNWDVNTTSIGICLAGDYSTSRPNNSMLCSLHDLLARYAPTTVLTHSLVNPQTSCPGTWVSREDWNQWKCCKG